MTTIALAVGHVLLCMPEANIINYPGGFSATCQAVNRAEPPARIRQYYLSDILLHDFNTPPVVMAKLYQILAKPVFYV